jgi:hypothetical protein
MAKLQFLIKKISNFFSGVNFFQYLVIKSWKRIRIRIGIQPKMLDPYMESINPDPEHCFFTAR